MIMTSIELQVPTEAKTYVLDKTTEEVRNALLLYSSIVNNTISHGRAAELLGISKMERSRCRRCYFYNGYFYCITDKVSISSYNNVLHSESACKTPWQWRTK